MADPSLLGDVPTPSDPRIHLLGLTRRQLSDVLEPWIDRPFRVDQIYRALYEGGAEDFEAMTSLSRELRRQLQDRFRVDPPEVESHQPSADGTVKYLFRLDDGATIETVDIPEERRRTLCISSQAGCALACRFCVTGFWGGGRNLTPGEIVAQVLAAKRLGPARAPSLNLVFMGMGEPLLNLENLEQALEILFEQISWRRVTVSTAGVIPGIEQMATWKKRPKLAISLHAADDDRRSEIMPINQKYPLADLLKTLRAFPLTPQEKLTFEYLLIREFNDSLKDADLLARVLSGLRAKVNLIPINPDPSLGESMRPPAPERIDAFREQLLRRGLFASIRRRRGDDVSAACGQLRAPHRAPRGFPGTTTRRRS